MVAKRTAKEARDEQVAATHLQRLEHDLAKARRLSVDARICLVKAESRLNQARFQA